MGFSRHSFGASSMSGNAASENKSPVLPSRAERNEQAAVVSLNDQNYTTVTVPRQTSVCSQSFIGAQNLEKKMMDGGASFHLRCFFCLVH
jgi:hypothetical protein